MNRKFMNALPMGLLILTYVTSFSVHAGNFVNGSYTPDQIRYGSRCDVRTCQSNDGGAGFVHYCNTMRASVMPPDQQPVYIWLSEKGSCYCPCDYAFEAQVTNQN